MMLAPTSSPHVDRLFVLRVKGQFGRKSLRLYDAGTRGRKRWRRVPGVGAIPPSQCFGPTGAK